MTMRLIQDLCACNTGVVEDGNTELFARIGRELPLALFRFPSGDTHNGWLVPDNWHVLRAKLFKAGEEVFDGTCSVLGVARYSRPFVGDLGWDDLRPHLITHPDLPEAHMFHCAWQYRPWDADWALSVPYRIYSRLGPGDYRVELETRYTPGEMLVAHHHKAGRSDKTIVFNAHTCHPHMANDGFAGVALLIRLFQWLASVDTFYSYRLVLGPEHLGTVFYLRDLPRAEVDRMVCGVFAEMPGTKGPLKAASTFLGDQVIDQAFANALRHHSRAYTLTGWRKGAGNDETVWEAPGYEVPFVELTRCEDQFKPFAEYHTDLDSPALMDLHQLDEMFAVLKRVVAILEENTTVRRLFDGLICLSNPRFDLYMERPDPAVCKDFDVDSEKWGHLLDCLFRYMDGETTILEIARRHDLPFERLRHYLARFEQKGLVRLERAEIARPISERIAS